MALPVRRHARPRRSHNRADSDTGVADNNPLLYQRHCPPATGRAALPKPTPVLNQIRLGLMFVRGRNVLTRQVALVSETDDAPSREVARIAAALQKQVTRDFGPIWDIPATVDGFATLEDVPLGYWPVIVVSDVRGAAGVHLDRNGQPFSLVEVGTSWSLTASHETLEMVADPFGDRVVAGRSSKPGQGRVEFLVEVCDPSEAEEFAYTVNDVLVSDFYTPHYFDPVQRPGVQYSFTGAITEPRQVLPGGYLSWHNPIDDHWYQLTHFGANPEFGDLGVLVRNGRSLREIIDSMTPQTQRLSRLAPESTQLTAAVRAASSSADAGVARAESLRKQVDDLKRTSRAGP
jgi:hypothetical protein